MQSVPGAAVGLAPDGIYVLQPSSLGCPANGPPCGNGAPGTAQYQQDGALLRYGRDLVGPPVTIASGLWAREPYMFIVDGYAIVSEDFSSYGLSLVDGSPAQDDMSIADTRPSVGDATGVYPVGSGEQMTAYFLRVTPDECTPFSVTIPSGLATSDFFNVADGFLYFPTDCVTNCNGTCGATIAPCALSGIQRVPIDGGVLEPVVTTGQEVLAVAALGADVYFAMNSWIYHTVIGNPAPPTLTYQQYIPRQGGLSAFPGGVLVSASWSGEGPQGAPLVLAAADGTTSKTILTSGPMPCVYAVWDDELIACTSGSTVYVARRP